MVEGNKVPVVLDRNMLGKTDLFLLWAKASPFVELFLLKDLLVLGRLY